MTTVLKYLIILITAQGLFHYGLSQDTSCKIMFYNVENLFDVQDDSLTEDDAFTPAGDMHWTPKRYYNKLNNLCKVIIAAGMWNPPEMIGLCEIENRKVLEDLIFHTSLVKFHYEIVHTDSRDRRGIDVAMLYDPGKVRVLETAFIRVNGNDLRTRDILYVKSTFRKDTCHVFINHWPSRSAGQIETDPGRMMAALLVREKVDSIMCGEPHARIIIMGDFNDEPQDESIVKGLRAMKPQASLSSNQLYNISQIPSTGPVRGTLKFQGTWNIFDQVIISGSLLMGLKGLNVGGQAYRVFQNGFLLQADETYNGVKPFRTYSGFRYKGGFSDHLPVIVEMMFK